MRHNDPRFQPGARVVLSDACFNALIVDARDRNGTVACHLTGDGMVVVKLDTGPSISAHITGLEPESAVDRLARIDAQGATDA